MIIMENGIMVEIDYACIKICDQAVIKRPKHTAVATWLEFWERLATPSANLKEYQKKKLHVKLMLPNEKFQR